LEQPTQGLNVASAQLIPVVSATGVQCTAGGDAEALGARDRVLFGEVDAGAGRDGEPADGGEAAEVGVDDVAGAGAEHRADERGRGGGSHARIRIQRQADGCPAGVIQPSSGTFTAFASWTACSTSDRRR
jgi:hypothetical protein